MNRRWWSMYRWKGCEIQWFGGAGGEGFATEAEARLHEWSRDEPDFIGVAQFELGETPWWKAQ